MTWNYRIIKKHLNGIDVFEVHEVYYKTDGSIAAWTENSIIPTGDTVEDLKKDFSRQLLAFKSDILDADQIEKQLKANQ